MPTFSDAEIPRKLHRIPESAQIIAAVGKPVHHRTDSGSHLIPSLAIQNSLE
jgi:hypothetical protein